MDETENIEKTRSTFDEIASDYEQLRDEERQQVKGIIIGMNLAKTVPTAAG